MHKIEPGLEKRIFSLYIGISAVLILLLVMAEWQLGKYKITQFENQHITSGLEAMDAETTAARQIVYAHIDTLTHNPTLSQLVHYQRETQIRKIFETIKTDPAITYIIIDKQQNISCCENWEPIKSTIADILQKSKDGSGGFFYSIESEMLYAIGYSALLYQDAYIGTAICTYPVRKTSATGEGISGVYSLFPLPDGLAQSYSLLEVKHIDRINEQVRYSSHSIQRISSAIAVGVQRLPGINSTTGVLGMVLYHREFNDFVQRGLVMVSLMIIGFSLMLMIFVGNVVSKTTLHPVKLLSKHMQKIQENPRLLLPFEHSYHGVLGEMVETFNSMNRSLADYGQSLLNYKVATDNLDAGVFWLDNEWNITFCNPALAAIFEAYDKYDIVGRQFSDFIVLDNRTLKRALSGEARVPNYVLKVNDKTKYIIINLRMIVEDNTKKIVGSVIDVTNELQEKKARETLEIELIRSNKLAEIGSRVEGIVHNLNSPLNTILGYAQLMKKVYPDNQDIDKIIASGKVISHDVKSLFRKIQEGSVSMKQPVDVNKILRQEIELLKHNLFFKHHVTLHQELEADIPLILAVSGDVSMCLSNILNNSIQALEERPTKEISVKTFTSEHMVAIQIKDTGIGISEDNFDVIFEPLYTTKKERGGSGFGLGLAISKRIVEDVGGRIAIESQPNQGSSFTVFFPQHLRVSEE